MRTTIDIRDDQRARLLEIAARQGRKGFSHLVQEAIDQFLSEREEQEGRIERAVEAVGSLDEQTVARLRQFSGDLRARWR